MRAQQVVPRGGHEGCVVAVEAGVVVVLTDEGRLRASYGAGLLARVARDHRLAPECGQWVQLRTWPDGPVTVERVLAVAPREPSLATVHPLRRG